MNKYYSFFHLNLAYSAISVDKYRSVIQKCYWPLLNLSKNLNLKFGLEVPGYTLEVINDIDPSWIKELALLIEKGLIELIGCGYSQLIGPLSPYEVNKKNIEIGDIIYNKLLGVKPKIALINEQAFSSSMIDVLYECGYKGFIAEYNNAVLINPDWDKEMQKSPQLIKGINHSLPVIWNNSTNFQKFQKFAHSEIELSEYMDFHDNKLNSYDYPYTIYGNDVEIFDFRPGRYMTEAVIDKSGEWIRITKLYELLSTKGSHYLPSEIISNFEQKNSSSISNIINPVPVKKQSKYNVVRWALSGRDDTIINTKCYKIYKMLVKAEVEDLNVWKKLCYAFSSDFRTHIDSDRWIAFKIFLEKFDSEIDNLSVKNSVNNTLKFNCKWDYSFNKKYLIIEGYNKKIILNLYKGLSIHDYYDFNISTESIFGTYEHGYFDNINYTADFYSGHMVYEGYGVHKDTDLIKISFGDICIDNNNDGLKLLINLDTKIGNYSKELSFTPDGSFKIEYKFLNISNLEGSLRLGKITLKNEFCDDGVTINSNLGHSEKENFYFKDMDGFHGDSVSKLISANTLLPTTNESLVVNNSKGSFTLFYDHSSLFSCVLVENRNVNGKLLRRLVPTVLEHDDTSKINNLNGYTFSLKIV